MQLPAPKSSAVSLDENYTALLTLAFFPVTVLMLSLNAISSGRHRGITEVHSIKKS